MVVTGVLYAGFVGWHVVVMGMVCTPFVEQKVEVETGAVDSDVREDGGAVNVTGTVLEHSTGVGALVTVVV